MLNNLRRKRVQRIDIEEWQYYNLKSDVWWKGIGVGYKDTNMTISKQRYSKKKMNQSFDHNLDIASTRIYVSSMIPCPIGSFWKGSNDSNDKNPIEEKKIEKAFLLGETEITQELYQAVMDGKNPSYFKDDPKNPVEQVSWYDALIFCNKLSDVFGLDQYYTIGNAYEIIYSDGRSETHYHVEMNEDANGFRLPTEWEWEYAAKAGTQLKYSGSDNVDEVGWYRGNSKVFDRFKTYPVKQKKPNAWGFYDMSGNVSEWCENKDQSNSARRVYRGGGWISPNSLLRSVARLIASADTRYSYLGFRVCRYM